MNISDSGVTILNGLESSMVLKVKEKQDSDLILLEHTHDPSTEGQAFFPRGRCASVPG